MEQELDPESTISVHSENTEKHDGKNTQKRC